MNIKTNQLKLNSTFTYCLCLLVRNQRLWTNVVLYQTIMVQRKTFVPLMQKTEI